jgi:hypothetical protein
MDKETKTLLITFGVAFIILWFTRPKGMKTSVKDMLGVKYAEPKKASDTDLKAKENATVALQAMKDAMANKEPKKELDSLNAMILKDYGLKILANKKTGKLRALDKSGKVVAEEA